MVFSEPIFLFLFLPATLAVYFLVPKAWRNALLLLASLTFYAWGEELYVLILLGSIALNYGFGLLIHGASGRARLVWLWAGVASNLGLLGYFKYTGFILENLGVPEAQSLSPALPIGISFFTFQALSYLIDLYFERIAVQKSALGLGLYISLFPQLIAGPIVRYSEIEAALSERQSAPSDIAAGTHRFVRGLAKKTLLADPLGLVADQIFALPEGALSPETAWLGALCYALQLYFDFSAYSDMAIGLGRIFGFRFPENFNYPYASRSITEFWRRWHMTLSRWFRDYLYIPLGGNRHGAWRTYFNLSVVFLATGIWHGAAWTFIFWGAFHGAFLILERVGLGALLQALPSVLQRVYLLFVVLMGWVAFRAVDFAQMSDFYRAMLLAETGPLAHHFPIERFATPYVLILLVLGAALSLGLRPWLATRLEALPAPGLRTELWFWGLFVVTLVSVGAASYSPFIYFRF